jgi:hypothetical protein
LGVLAALVAAVCAVPASASVTLGQLAPTPSGNTPNVDIAQLSVTSGASYQVQEAGTIVSWSHNAGSGASQKLTMKVFRKTHDPDFYTVVGLDGPHDVTANLVNTFPASIPVQPGDILGNFAPSGAVATVFNGTPQDQFLNRSSVAGVGLGEEAGFTESPGVRVNLSAVLVPTNTLTLGSTALNKKKGTATLNVTLPNPGDLTATGSGASAASAGRAVISKAVGAGPAQLLVKATGKKRKTLNATGKVKLNMTITYTPTGGDPSFQSVKVKLKKN